MVNVSLLYTDIQNLLSLSTPLKSDFCLSSSDFSPQLDRGPLGPWRPNVTGQGLYEDSFSTSPSLTPLLPPQSYLSLEGQNGEERVEENIVYL